MGKPDTEVAPLKKCAYRQDSQYEKWYQCRHSQARIPFPNRYVNRPVCEGCQVNRLVDQSPVEVIKDAKPPDEMAVLRTEKKPPPTIKKLWNATKAVAQFVEDKGRTVDKDQYQQRLAICEVCPEKHPDSPTCNACGCNLLAKATVRSWTCPLERWPLISKEGKQVKRKLLLSAMKVCPGDILMLSVAIRDLHKAFPGDFLTGVKTTADYLFENNPDITDFGQDEQGVELMEIDYPLIHKSNDGSYHLSTTPFS